MKVGRVCNPSGVFSRLDIRTNRLRLRRVTNPSHIQPLPSSVRACASAESVLPPSIRAISSMRALPFTF
jgi:hypothetical protein